LISELRKAGVVLGPVGVVVNVSLQMNHFVRDGLK